jgi:hypothetical protein
MIAVVSGVLSCVVLGNRLMRLWSASDSMRKEGEFRREGRLVREMETRQKQRLTIIDAQNPELPTTWGKSWPFYTIRRDGAYPGVAFPGRRFV